MDKFPPDAPGHSGPAGPPSYSQPPQQSPPYQAQAPPPQGVPQQQPRPGVIIAGPPQQFIVTTFQESPQRVRCPNCNNDVLSNTTFIYGNLTWIVVGVLAFLGFWLCCFIPFCIDSLKDVNHTCPVCSYHLGKFERVKI